MFDKMKRISAVVMISLFLFVNNCFAVSLWSEESDMSSLFRDQRAARVQDIITVIISETSAAQRSATTTTGRDSSVDGKVENWFTIDNFKNLLTNILSSQLKSKSADTTNLPVWKLSTKNDYKGSGTTTRDDSLSAKITCKVIEILPNKNLVIEGKQTVSVNAEEQIIVLRGIVRQQDVLPNNTVYSYNVADANIQFFGKGAIGDKQKRGILQMIGDIVWPL